MNASPTLLDEFLEKDVEKYDNNKPTSYFTAEQLSKLDPRLIPKHIAIIPDGNRRWAKRRDMSTNKGHESGADILIEVVKAAKELGISAITIFSFSTENWFRSKEEVNALMWLIETYLLEQRETMVKEGIRLQMIGDMNGLPLSLKEMIEETMAMTKEGGEVDLILAINYGGRNEILRAVKKVVSDVVEGGIKAESITEASFSQYLDTSPWQDPDLLIRTSGQMRISNFLIWQTSYTEIYVLDVLWPDFTPQHLYRAIFDYQKRERRLGY